MEDSAGESAESDTQDLKKRADPAKRLTRIVLAAVAILFGCHMAADRYTPYTTLGRIDGFIVPVVPQVLGLSHRSQRPAARRRHRASGDRPDRPASL